MELASSIKALIFDFGNVIINIDFELTRKAFTELIGDDFDAYFAQWKEDKLYAQFESATFSAEEMADKINTYIDKPITSEQVKTAWNALLLDLPKERLELLARLKERYPLYLLSNTNLVHIDHIFSNLERKYGENPMDNLFERLFLSYQMGHVKPDAGIYEYVLNEIPFKANECIFFDDLQENLDGAAALGFQTQIVTKEKGILELFEGVI